MEQLGIPMLGTHARTHRKHAVIVAAESAILAAWHFCGGAAQSFFTFHFF